VSGLRQAAEDCPAMRRALGFALVRGGQMLMSFITHLEHAAAASITTELTVWRWCLPTARCRFRPVPRCWRRCWPGGAARKIVMSGK
jgi:hypothetical protein